MILDGVCYFKKNPNAPRPSEHPPVRGGGISKRLGGIKGCKYKKQPIMRIEDRLFDRGWVRSAMATRKCGNIYFPKYFMAVRPFFTRNFFQE